MKRQCCETEKGSGPHHARCRNSPIRQARMARKNWTKYQCVYCGGRDVVSLDEYGLGDPKTHFCRNMTCRKEPHMGHQVPTFPPLTERD